MGRTVYGGVYDPASGEADKDGFRWDVLSTLRSLNMTTMRYPGGNFASGYHWEDGVGPLDKRPTVCELAWQSIEPNSFSTDEYIRLCRKMTWIPMLTVNRGTGTPEEARNRVEYCNSPAGTRYANIRAANGNIERHGVGMFVYILATISIATLLILFHIHPAYSAPLLCAYTFIMFTAMMIHPFTHWITNRKGLSHGNQ